MVSKRICEGLMFFIDELHGDDGNSGLTVDEALATRAEAMRRVAGRQRDITITIFGDETELKMLSCDSTDA